MIDSYNFGHIVIDTISFDHDVIVFPDRVQDNWWRKEGHTLHIEDIRKALEEIRPKTLVVGTGKFGVMRVAEEVKSYCEEHHVTLYAEPSENAVKTYNRLFLVGDRIVGAFHLTC